MTITPDTTKLTFAWQPADIQAAVDNHLLFLNGVELSADQLDQLQHLSPKIRRAPPGLTLRQPPGISQEALRHLGQTSRDFASERVPSGNDPSQLRELASFHPRCDRSSQACGRKNENRSGPYVDNAPTSLMVRRAAPTDRRHTEAHKEQHT